MICETCPTRERYYGTWTTCIDAGSRDPEDAITRALDGCGMIADFDVDAIADDYRAAIAAALPDGWHLDGDELIGPAPGPTGLGDAVAPAGYSTDEYGDLDFAAIVSDIDLWDIIARHDLTAAS